MVTKFSDLTLDNTPGAGSYVPYVDPTEAVAADRSKRVLISNIAGIANGALSVLDYGAVGDGTTDDTAAFQSWATALGAHATANNCGAVGVIPPLKYLITGTVTIPAIVGRLTINADGSTISKTGTGPAFASTRPTSNVDAEGDISGRSNWLYRGFEILGDGTAGQVGIRHEAGLMVTVDESRFRNCPRGVEMAFCLESRITNCEFVLCSDVAAILDDGVGRWTGATRSNSAPNASVIQRCRVFNPSGARASFVVNSGGAVAIRDCVTEGANPVNNIEYRGSLSTSALQFTVDNLHTENSPTNAHVLIDTEHKAYVHFGYVIGSSGIYVDNTGSGAASVTEVHGVPEGDDSIGAGSGAGAPYFRTDGNGLWVFMNVLGRGRFDPHEPANWAGAVTPGAGGGRNVVHVGFNDNQSSGNYPSFGTGRELNGSLSGGAALSNLVAILTEMDLITDNTTA